MRNNDSIQLNLPASHKYLNVLGACVSAMLERAEDVQDRGTLAYNVQLAVHEICTNIIEHAYGEEDAGDIVVAWAVADGRFIVTIRDSGRSFDLGDVESQSLPVEGQDGVPEVQVGGLGVHFMRKMMDDVSFSFAGGVNTLTLVKNFEE